MREAHKFEMNGIGSASNCVLNWDSVWESWIVDSEEVWYRILKSESKGVGKGGSEDLFWGVQDAKKVRCIYWAAFLAARAARRCSRVSFLKE